MSDLVERNISARFEHPFLSAELHRALFEEGADGLFIAGPRGRLIAVNPRGAELTGYSLDELLAMALTDLIATEDLPRDPFRFEERALRRKDGSLLPVETGARILSDGNAMAIVRDVSRLKAVRRTLAKSEERLRQAIRVSHIGIFDHDHRTGSIYWSPEIFEIYDWDPTVPLPLPAFIERLHPEDREKVAAAVPRAHDPAGDGLYDIEYRLVRRDGSIRCLTTRSQTFFEGEGAARHPVRTVGAVRDITEQKQAVREQEKLQAQLFQAQKMESIGRLAGGVAHDFNNMLSVILGYVGMALGRLDPVQPIHADLREVQKAAQRSADLTRQLLAFARMQTAAPKVIDLNEVVAGSLQMLRRLIGEDIRLAWTPDRDPWLVRIDPVQVDQVLANLVVNARDAIAGVGEIAIRTKNVVLDAAYCARHLGFLPGDYLVLEVADDGCGMDQETKALVFEPFFTTKAEGRGTGLGLATVYGIVRQNDGFINVSSELGQGTTVTVYLPRSADEGAAARTEVPAEATQRGTETILLVEDEKSVLQVNKILLESLGYRVLPAGTPTEAIRLARKHAGRIHLLVTDVVMPEMNGRELAERLASRYPGLRCLYMSGYLAGGIAHHGLLDEGIHFLQKPFSLNSLAAKVRDALGRAVTP